MVKMMLGMRRGRFRSGSDPEINVDTKKGGKRKGATPASKARTGNKVNRGKTKAVPTRRDGISAGKVNQKTGNPQVNQKTGNPQVNNQSSRKAPATLPGKLPSAPTKQRKRAAAKSDSSVVSKALGLRQQQQQRPSVSQGASKTTLPNKLPTGSTNQKKPAVAKSDSSVTKVIGLRRQTSNASKSSHVYMPSKLPHAPSNQERGVAKSGSSVRFKLGLRPSVKRPSDPERHVHFGGDDATQFTFNTLPERRLHYELLAMKQQEARFDSLKAFPSYVGAQACAIGLGLVEGAQKIGTAMSGCVQDGAAAIGGAVTSGAAAVGLAVTTGATVVGGAVMSGTTAVGSAVTSGTTVVGSAMASGAAAVGGAMASGAAAVGGSMTSAHEGITSIEMPTLETSCVEARDEEELACTYLEMPASTNSYDQASRSNSSREQPNDQSSRHSSRSKSMHSTAHESRHSSNHSVQSSNAGSRHSYRNHESHYSSRDQESRYSTREQKSRHSSREQESRHSSREQASHYSSKAQASKTNSQRNADVSTARGKASNGNASTSHSQATYPWENLDDESLVLRPKVYLNQIQVGRELVDYDNLTVAYNEAVVNGDLDDPGCNSDMMGRCFQWDDEGDEYSMTDGGDEYTMPTIQSGGSRTYQSGGSRTYQSGASQTTATHSIGQHYIHHPPSTIVEGDEERTYDSFDETRQTV